MLDRRENQNFVFGNVILIYPTVNNTINFYNCAGGASVIENEDFANEVAANVAAGFITEFGFWVLHIVVQLSTLMGIDLPLIAGIMIEVLGRMFGVKHP